MSVFHLQARLFEGPLHAPKRDESRQFATDDPERAAEWAIQAHVEGCTVWLYTHDRSNPLQAACDWRLIARIGPRDRVAELTARLEAPEKDQCRSRSSGRRSISTDNHLHLINGSYESKCAGQRCGRRGRGWQRGQE